MSSPREQCEHALARFDGNDRNFRDDCELFYQLIKEHFDNQPLKGGILMKTSIDYPKSTETSFFRNIKDKECFYSNGVLYMKIFSQDLHEYCIHNVNAISVINAGLTYFDSDEVVYKAEKIVRKQVK